VAAQRYPHMDLRWDAITAASATLRLFSEAKHNDTLLIGLNARVDLRAVEE